MTPMGWDEFEQFASSELSAPPRQVAKALRGILSETPNGWTEGAEYINCLMLDNFGCNKEILFF
jgi:hypothetical protein